MITGILFVISYILITYFIAGILPILITEKIFKFRLSKKKYFSFSLYILFTPISLLFTKFYYNDLKIIKAIDSKKQFIKVILVMIFSSILLSLFVNNIIIKKYAVMPFQSNGQSMYSTIYDKQFILTTKVSLNNERGDVIVYKPGVSEFKTFFLGRIIGLPGEVIKIEDGKVFLKVDGNFKELEEKYLNDESNGSTFVKGIAKEIIYQVPKNSYFMLGDNRNHSTDSRSCFSSCGEEGNTEFIPKENIIGKYFFDLGYFDFKKLEYKHPHLGIETTPKFFDIK